MFQMTTHVTEDLLVASPRLSTSDQQSRGCFSEIITSRVGRVIAPAWLWATLGRR
jgi:hypothetical protein